MFEVKVGMKKIGEFEKFTKAFKMFWQQTIKTAESGTSKHWLEIANLIVYVAPGKMKPMSFYQARDFAYSIGLLVDGELQEIEEPEESVIRYGFRNSSIEHLRTLAENLERSLVKLN